MRMLRMTAQRLTDARVVVYPVDARGLVGVTAFDASSQRLGYGQAFGDRVNRSLGRVVWSQMSMKALARDTGGLAFVNRNDLDRAVALSVADGSSYYVLGYYREDKSWDGEFHEIEVKVDRPELEVRHRQGYYALSPTEWEKQSEEVREVELMWAMKPDTPPATMILFDARVVHPAVADRMEVPVELMVDPRTLSAEETEAGGWRYSLSVHVAAYGPDGRVVAHKDRRLEAPLTPEAFAIVREQGFPYHTELELSPGRYQLRVAVRDLRTGFIGTVDAPLMLE
jgi:hypothetical protein